ncbi:hypothetical protein HAX54_011294 [Datura stramonium]|uniref:Uncharacterized protein n=1 Tax=Datura stramonium TaxID=4076 RepID=A0ABS8RX28_DATST|nr:hypothetical protein [Datura stramonium]
MSNIDAPTSPSDEIQRIAHIRFRLAGMEKYHMSFKEKWSIHAKTQLENTIKVPIEVEILIAFIMDHMHINVGEINVDQFKRRAKQQATSLPYSILVSMLCVWASCPLFRPLDKTVRAHGMITLDTKTDKDASALKKAKGTQNMTQPPTPMPSSTTEGQYQVAKVLASTPTDLLKITQMAQAHESQIVKLAKVIPYMIQQVIKKAMQPATDNLRGLYATVEVLENDMIALRKDVATLTRPPPTSNLTPPEPAAVTPQFE